MRKAQSGMNAAILIAVILGLIVLYVVFLPTSERERLFYNKTLAEKEAQDDEDILLLEYPKSLNNVEDIDTKDIPNIYLFRTTDAKEIESINPFTVRNGVFDKKEKTATFMIENPENTENVILSFTAKKYKGVLIIELNGETVYEKEITSGAAGPVKLRKDLLKKDNTLKFSVSSVGFAFWKTNEYVIEDIRIIGDITDITRQKSQNVFSLSQTEYQNLEKATLRFVPYCGNVQNVGKLVISVNSQDVFSAVPVCDDAYRQIIPTGTLNEGENYIIFQTQAGSYSLEQISLEFETKETKKKIYYFEVNETNWKKIEGGRDVTLSITFVDDDSNKMADLSVNGHLTSIDQDEKDYSRNIKSWIEEGNNYIEIQPRTALDIKELKVEID